MLRKRSRSKQALMADNGSFLPSATQKQSKTTSFPKLFTTFSFKSFTENDAVASPTSILDAKPFSVFKNPFFTGKNPKTQEPETRHKVDPKGIGLAIIDTLLDDQKPEPQFLTRNVLLGSQLRIQIPSSPSDSPRSPADFGIKTRNSQLGSFSLLEKKNTASGSIKSDPGSPQVFTSCLSVSEMELSEVYTCVISHGPNPKTIHIFDNCIVESHDVRSYDPVQENGSDYRPWGSFLSYCNTCKKNLGHGKDIFMYRGEKAFCSEECRSQEMMLEEDINNLELDDIYETCS